jgi:DNA-binding HxlR family transcriptional regulator
MNWPALARSTDPETSHEAAKLIDASRIEWIILDEFRKARKGLTAEELSRRIPGIPLNTLTPRLAPLLRRGLLINAFERRKASSGRYQRVLQHFQQEDLTHVMFGITPNETPFVASKKRKP